MIINIFLMISHDLLLVGTFNNPLYSFPMFVKRFLMMSAFWMKLTVKV
uniref:Uncharacterized protein n=1 Tax=Manihot esculenta TaxID=3983 RepID=A0A2C9UYU2_MANES